MEYRNLVRLLVFKKALRLHGKKAFKVAGSDVFILLSLYLWENKTGPITMASLNKHLGILGRSVAADLLNNRLKEFRSLGILNKDRSGRYSLTPSGVLLLNTIEKRCRLTRWDK